jgi:dihydrofolate reductase
VSKLLHLVAACAENRVIGRDGKLPWHIPEDIAHFKRLTARNVCIMGRVCFDTWPDARRDGRQAIVLTNHPLPAETPPGERPPLAAHSLEHALALADTVMGEVYVCGGQQIFADTLALRLPMRLHLTLIHAEIPGDRFFPEWRTLAWREIERRDSADANYRYTFYTLDRVG